jgi:hypothetical protein
MVESFRQLEEEFLPALFPFVHWLPFPARGARNRILSAVFSAVKVLSEEKALSFMDLPHRRSETILASGALPITAS